MNIFNKHLFGSMLFLALPYVSLALSGCGFMPDAPVIEFDFPSLQYQLKFLDVQPKVYRTTLSKGSTPRLRIIRYSSAPVIEIDDVSREVLISTKGSNCFDHTAAPVASLTSAPSGSNIFTRTSAPSWSYKAAPSKSPVSAPTTRSDGFSLHVSSKFMTPFVTTTLALAMTSGRLSLTVVGGAIAASMALLFSDSRQSGFAMAALNETCTPSIEIVLEAPPYYLGSVDACLAEVENPDHCPLPFPAFKTASDPNPHCKLAVVGAGAGGLYTAMRLVEEKKVNASDVCLFEATDRVGGRLYSLRGFGPENDISVDSGGYRTWPKFTPVLHALITEKLGLNVSCYQKVEPCLQYNIVGKTGEKVGFATFVEKMMQILVDKGAAFYPRHSLSSFYTNATGVIKHTLYFANGVIATAPEVVLNVPQQPLLRILRESAIPMTDDNLKQMYDAVHSVQPEIATKLYLYYKSAFWPKLGLFNGDFSKSGDARNMLLEGRYHDGHIKCDSTGKECYGFLLAVYAHDFAGNKAQYFRRFQRDRPEPVTVISNTDPEGAAFLQHAHERLVQYHMEDMPNRTFTLYEANKVFSATAPPEFAVLSTWNIATFGAGGAWHGWTDPSNVLEALFPLNSIRVHVVNEAFSTVQGWAEGSLRVADRVLKDYFDVKPPWSFNVSDLVQIVSQTSSDTCAVGPTANVTNTTSTNSTSGGGGGSNVTSGGDDNVVDPLCFTSSARVHMANGTVVQISRVREGDYVDTGFGFGRVTKFLEHHVHDKVEVAVIPTPLGDLVGTPDHPVYVGGKWYEIKEAAQYGLVDATVQLKYVDVFYNLEVDGDAISPSLSHSYMVNGIVASGLGDHPILNQIHKRQKVWQRKELFSQDIEPCWSMDAFSVDIYTR